MKKNNFIESGAIVATGDHRYLIGYGKKRWLEREEGENTPLFYFPDYFLTDPTPWLQFEHTQEVTLTELITLFSGGSSLSMAWTPPQKRSFELSFQELQGLFKSHTLKKGVPYVFETSNEAMTPEKIEYLLFQLTQYAKQSPGYLYGFWGEGEGMLGASPELLFKCEKGRELQTVACAGTLGEHQSEEDFFNDPKERHEHQLVIDGIKESLAFCGQVEQGELQLLKLSRLTHLLTPIHLKMEKESPFIELVKALHPTPALGALPKKEGMKWLQELEKRIERGRYGAPVGYTRGNEQVCYVAIRNIQFDKDGIRIGAGCGVVPASQFENEWKEIHRKINAIKGMLGI